MLKQTTVAALTKIKDAYNNSLTAVVKISGLVLGTKPEQIILYYYIFNVDSIIFLIIGNCVEVTCHFSSLITCIVCFVECEIFRSTEM